MCFCGRTNHMDLFYLYSLNLLPDDIVPLLKCSCASWNGRQRSIAMWRTLSRVIGVIWRRVLLGVATAAADNVTWTVTRQKTFLLFVRWRHFSVFNFYSNFRKHFSQIVFGLLKYLKTTLFGHVVHKFEGKNCNRETKFWVRHKIMALRSMRRDREKQFRNQKTKHFERTKKGYRQMSRREKGDRKMDQISSGLRTKRGKIESNHSDFVSFLFVVTFEFVFNFLWFDFKESIEVDVVHMFIFSHWISIQIDCCGLQSIDSDLSLFG